MNRPPIWQPFTISIYKQDLEVGKTYNIQGMKFNPFYVEHISECGEYAFCRYRDGKYTTFKINKHLWEKVVDIQIGKQYIFFDCIVTIVHKSDKQICVLNDKGFYESISYEDIDKLETLNT